MDIKNKIMDENELDAVSGGRNVTFGARKVWQCFECGERFNSAAEWKEHSKATGHANHTERYE